MMNPPRALRLKPREACCQGFSLLELMVAMGVFLVVSGISFALFSQHQALLATQQATVGLNIGLRNALAQIQLDVANAGNGLILGTNVPAWPVGVTINNNTLVASQCNPTATSPPTYVAACYDQLNVIVVDPNTPAIHPCATSGCTISTSAGSTADGLPAAVINPATGLLYTAAQLASHFNIGDQVLFVQSCSGGGHPNGSSGCMFTTALLTTAGATNTAASGCSTGCVSLNFTSTGVGGTNSSANDPLGMTTANVPAGILTDTFGQGDWVVRLLPITYSVNASHVDSGNQPDPQLIRTQAGTQNAVMDQVIGFKVGAALWNAANSTSNFQYDYNASDYSSQYNLIRSVRVSIIGRTGPNPTNRYRNPFDSGPYQIHGDSIIVDPRNLTMNND